MKQVVQNLKTGKAQVEEVPAPVLAEGSIQVRNAASLISVGTERMLMDFASKSLIGKAKQRPDLVKQVVNKARRDGIVSTVQTIRGRLDEVVPIGYSCSGVVVAAGGEVAEFKEGETVACAGGGYANHAEIVCVPKNLAVKVPPEVDCENAAFVTLGAIAMQGVRIAEVSLGENVGVIGLGLVGQIAVQLLKAAGCNVFGVDISAQRAELALQMGADQVASGDAGAVIQAVDSFTRRSGLDAVIITAATEDNGPVELAGEISRDKGCVVALGAVRMDVPRRTYYHKELELRLSRSYGPGRYDPQYEEKGVDYPYGYVRWTEKRNMEAFVGLLAQGKIDMKPLISHRYSVERASDAYGLIAQGGEPFLGILLEYPVDPSSTSPARILLGEEDGSPLSGATAVRIGMIGAGGFARSTLLPALKKVDGVKLTGISTAGGLSAKAVGKQYRFAYCTSDNEEIFGDEQTDAIIIATRHNLHAPLACQALAAGKHVFVEKPLAMDAAELRDVVAAFDKSDKVLMVGFNRRFSPLVQEIGAQLRNRSAPLAMTYRINAGAIPLDSWVHDPDEGGGRIIGEVCHFVDLMVHFAGCPPVQVYAQAISPDGPFADDTLNIELKFPDGSIGHIGYFANGDTAYSKERFEVFCGETVAVLEDFRMLELVYNGRVKKIKKFRQDKGHGSELQAFAAALQGKGPSPIPFVQLAGVTSATFCILESLRSGRPVAVPAIDHTAD